MSHITIYNFISRCLLILLIVKFSDAGIHIDRVAMCDQSDYPFKVGMTVKDSGDKQILEKGYMDAKMDLNNDILNTVTIYQLDDEKQWSFLLSKTDPVCTMIENFIGEFIKGLEKASGLKQTCPYPKGKYEVKNYPLDFDNFKYKDFPPGSVKVKFEYHGKNDTKKLLGCYEVEFTLK